jgi:hypothetical protein
MNFSIHSSVLTAKRITFQLATCETDIVLPASRKADAERAAFDEAAIGELRELAKPLLEYAREHAI